MKKQITSAWHELRAEGLSPQDCANALIGWAMGDDLPGDRARISGPTMRQMDDILAELLREERQRIA